jgi:hypothetical protein
MDGADWRHVTAALTKNSTPNLGRLEFKEFQALSLSKHQPYALFELSFVVRARPLTRTGLYALRSPSPAHPEAGMPGLGLR